VSDTDSFIEEVNEEVRRDQLYKYVRKFGWIGIVLVVGIVGATGFNEWQKSQDILRAQNLGNKLVAALEADEPKARADALAVVSADAADAKIVVDLRRAGELVAADDKAGALEVLDQVAKSGASPVYSDLAALKAVILRGADMDPATRDAALAALSAPGGLYRPLALEQQGVVALAAGKSDQAITIFSELYQDSEATDALRNRATQILVSLGAELPAITQLLSE
jgi:hypothetical protein